MAPSALTVADNNYRLAANKLVVACTQLDRHLPPDDDIHVSSVQPPARPRRRIASVPACRQCAVQLQDANPGEREAHVCTHNPDGEQEQQSEHGSDTNRGRDGTATRGKRKQPNAELIKSYVATLDERFDAFTTALSILAGLLGEEETQSYNDHLIVWAEFVGDMRDRAYETIQILEAALLGTARLDQGAGLDTRANTQPPKGEIVHNDQPIRTEPTDQPTLTQPNEQPVDREPVRTDQQIKDPVIVDLRNQPGISNAVLSPHSDIFQPVPTTTNLGSELQAPLTGYRCSITEARQFLLLPPI